MKIYKINELKGLAKKAGYKMAALEDSSGKRLLAFNRINVTLDKQFGTIDEKLKSELVQNGIYYVVMANSIAGCKQPDRFAVNKGRVSEEQMQKAENTPVIIHSGSTETLSLSESIDLIRENANYKAENEILKKTVADLERELEEADLGEGQEDKPPAWASFLMEQAPVLTGLANEYFAQNKRKLDLEERKIELGHTTNAPKKKAIKGRVVIKPGSQEHLNLIEKYFNEDNDEKLNAQLDKLEAANPDLYAKVCEKLGIEIEEEEGEEEQQ
jgi:hypothetical protein